MNKFYIEAGDLKQIGIKLGAVTLEESLDALQKLYFSGYQFRELALYYPGQIPLRLFAEGEENPIITIEVNKGIQLNATPTYYENENLVAKFYGEIMKEWFRRKKAKEDKE